MSTVEAAVVVVGRVEPSTWRRSLATRLVLRVVAEDDRDDREEVADRPVAAP